jgi:hypothetical protein
MFSDSVSTNVTSVALETATTLSDISSEVSKQEEDMSNYQVAFCISAFLLCLASAGHLLAFCVRKVYDNKKIVRTIGNQ